MRNPWKHLKVSGPTLLKPTNRWPKARNSSSSAKDWAWPGLPRAPKDMVQTYGTHTKTIKHTHAQLLYRYIFIHIRKYQKYIFSYQIWSDCIFDVILEPSFSSDSSISGYFLLGYEGEICSSDSLVDRLEDVDVLQKLERVSWQLLWTYGANGCPSVVESICKIDLHRTAIC